MSYSPYKKLECGPYENLTPFHYPISPYNKHCFTNSQFLEQAEDLYKNSLEPKIRELAYNLSYMVADGDILTDKQIGLFKNTYKRFKKGETLNGI
ncbi:hypothetical protein EB001_09825 [bacterium]|nr:hypothetical protein [bacterium]